MGKGSWSYFHHLLKVDLLLKQSGKPSLFGAVLATPLLLACHCVEQRRTDFQPGALEAFQGPCICWNSRLLEAPSQAHLPSLPPTLVILLHHSNPWCHWVKGQMPTQQATLCLQPSFLCPLALDSFFGVWANAQNVVGTEAGSGSVLEGSDQVLVAQGRLMSPGTS